MLWVMVLPLETRRKLVRIDLESASGVSSWSAVVVVVAAAFSIELIVGPPWNQVVVKARHGGTVVIESNGQISLHGSFQKNVAAHHFQFFKERSYRPA